ncbi:entry exclusion lipoprotein TrbK [Oxalobacteraceae bacterium]|nr:entry exclusion lipoprotein TrbK [Oxalobacteraceae bacterium]
MMLLQTNTLAPVALALFILAGCSSKPDPQLIADQMTLTDAACQEAAVKKIEDEVVRAAFAARCIRRGEFKPSASKSY